MIPRFYSIRQSLVLLSLALAAIEPVFGLDQPTPTTWDCSTGDPLYVLWRATVGDRSGSLSTDGRIVLVGTNNRSVWDSERVPPNTLLTQRPPREAKNDAALLCFDANTGEFRWRITHSRLASRKHDIPGYPLSSNPFIEDDRAYYVSNRGELVCVDVLGFSDAENDGPHRGETNSDTHSGDVVWVVDMVRDLGVFKRDAGDGVTTTSSPLVVGDLVYCLTGNGSDFGMGSRGVPAPGAPSLIAVNKKTGVVAWSSNAPGADIMFRQASSPARLDYDGQSEIVFPAGDGNLYSFDAVSGRRISTLQCNLPGTTRWGVRNNKWHRGSRLYFEAPPVVYDNVVYVGMTQEFEATGTRPGWPIVSVASPRERGAPSKSILWRFRTETHGGTTRSVAVDDRMVYAILHPTTLFAIDRETGKEVWRWPFDLDADVLDCSSPAIDGKRLYVPVGEYIHVFSTESTPHLVGRYFLGELGSGAHRHCQIRNGKLYVATNGLVWCLRTL